MQYLLSVIDDIAGRSDEELDNPTASAEEEAAIDVFNQKLMDEGSWVFAGGLRGPHAATVVDNRGAESVVTDGPFVESKEFLAGFWVIEAADLDVALALANEGSKACNRKVEVRPFH